MEQAVNRFPLTRMLLRFTLWLERKMHKQEDFSLNDPEWNELQNKVSGLKNGTHPNDIYEHCDEIERIIGAALEGATQ